MDFIDIHTHKNISDTNVSILNTYPNSTNFDTLFSIGIHPWYIKEENTDTELSFIAQQLQHKNCIALGECGLDKLSETDYKLQLKVFKAQILLSEEYQKPLIIHCVKSFQEVLLLKKDIKPQQPWIIHGFNKNSQVAVSLIKNNCFVSFGKSLLQNEKLQDAFKEISLENIFLETDDSEIAIETIYKKAAEIKNVTIKEIKKNIHQNFNKIFIK